ncbi:MAG: hypothetical protein ACK441_02030, partial [Burkholderiales bacterium]
MQAADKNVAIRLVVGLGNPGPEHESDRHNAGFWCLDRLLPKLDPAARCNHEAKF